MNGASLELGLVLISEAGPCALDGLTMRCFGCACAVGLREGKRESDEV